MGAIAPMMPVLAKILPFALAATSIGTSVYQGQQAKKTAEKAQTGSLQTWQETAYPKPEIIQAAGTESRGQLAQARLGAYQNLASQMAARGFGAGSGLIGREASTIERGYLQALGKQATDLTRFAGTPMWGPPSTAYPAPVSGALETGLGKGTDLLDTALGYYMMKQLIG